MPNSRFHIIIVNYPYAVEGMRANELLNQTSVLTQWAEAVQAAGAKVTVFQRFSHDEAVQRANVTYHLIQDRFGLDLRVWQLPRQLHWDVRVLCMASINVGYATLVHVNGFSYPLQIWHLRSLLPPGCAIALQHQGGSPWPWPQRLLQQWSLQMIDGFLFASPQAAETWPLRALLSPQQSVHVLSEALASPLSPKPDVNAQYLNIYREIFAHRLRKLG